MRHLGDCRDSHRCVTSHRRRVVVASSSPRRRLDLHPLPDLAAPWSPRLVLTPLFWSGVRTRGLQGVASSSRRRRRVPFPSSPRRPSRIAVVVSRFATSACNASPRAAVTTAGRAGELGAAGRLCTWATWVGPANDGTAATDCWRRRSVHGSELDSPMPWAVHRRTRTMPRSSSTTSSSPSTGKRRRGGASRVRNRH